MTCGESCCNDVMVHRVGASGPESKPPATSEATSSTGIKTSVKGDKENPDAGSTEMDADGGGGGGGKKRAFVHITEEDEATDGGGGGVGTTHFLVANF